MEEVDFSSGLGSLVPVSMVAVWGGRINIGVTVDLGRNSEEKEGGLLRSELAVCLRLHVN